MQILGIYINEGDKKVIKSLSTGWYPFGDIEDCHKEYLERKTLGRIRDNILSTQSFINDLYSFNKEKALKININCIVGKNGSGKLQKAFKKGRWSAQKRTSSVLKGTA